MRMLDRTADGTRDVVLLIARLALAVIFVESSIVKLAGIEGFALYLTKQGIPLPYAATIIGSVIELAGALAIIIGYQIRLGTVALIAFTIAASLIGHRFWELEGASRNVQLIHAMKNLAIIGGLLLLFANGGGRFALGTRRARP